MKFNSLRSRRDFLRFGVSTISTLGAAAAFGEAGLLSASTQAAAPDYKALVCIFLFGGNDANNLLIPNESSADTRYGYSTYKNVRQNLALSQASLAAIHDPVSNKAFGMHPSLQPLADLYTKSSRVGLVANVGPLIKPVPLDSTGKHPNLNAVPLPVNLFSHSDQTGEWQNGVPQGGSSTGWAGRLADRIYVPGCSPASSPGGYAGFPPSIGISGNSLQLIGHCTQPTTVSTSNFGLIGMDHTAIADARMTGLQNMLSLKSGVTLIQAAQNSMTSAIEVAKIIDQASSQTPITGFPNTDLGNQLAQVANIIRMQGALGTNRQIFFCSQGGYDTHSDELKQQGQLLADLAQAMAAFDTALGALNLLPNVTTFTESEFNRTFQPNGNAGTDHAWGTHTMVMGGAVKGGQIFGKYPQLVLTGPDDSGDRGNWVPSTSVDQYGGAMAKWFGVQAQADLDYVFPNLVNFGYNSTLPIFG